MEPNLPTTRRPIRLTSLFAVSYLSAMFPLVCVTLVEPVDLRTASSEPSAADAAADAASPVPPSCPYLIGFLPALSLSKGQSKYFVGAIDYALRRVNAAAKCR